VFQRAGRVLPERRCSPFENYVCGSFFSPLLNQYYRMRGWDENRVLPEEKLAELGLKECIKCVR
jgi:aldehyde:ferredoxin oxidoreductase